MPTDLKISHDEMKQCYQHAMFSNYAYLDAKEGKKAYKACGYKGYKYIDTDGAQAHIIWNTDAIVICFRGTEPSQLSDVAADLNAWPDNAQVGGFVHNGFQNELEKIWHEILITLANHLTKRLTITGHSLGGAMATVAASRLKDRIHSLYTFGSPRVGTKKMVEAFKEVKHYRFVNNNDIVPTVPFAFMGYRHHCPPMYIDFHGHIHDQYSIWKRIGDKYRGRWAALKKFQFFDRLMDHQIPKYCKYCLEEMDMMGKNK